MKYLIIFLCICNLVGCTGINNNNQTPKDKKGIYVSQPNYISRLQSKKIEHSEKLDDGAELIHEVNINFSPTNDLKLSIFFNGNNQNNILFIKSNMRNEKIIFFEDKMDKFKDKDYIIKNLRFDLCTYRIIEITIDKEICWLPLDDLIDEQLYPEEIEAIYKNHPPIPKYKDGTIVNIIVDDSNGKYIQLESADVQEIMYIYSEIDDDRSFWDNKEDKGAPVLMLTETFYMVVDDKTYRFDLLLNRGTMIDYCIYPHENKRVYEILEKYVVLNQP